MGELKVKDGTLAVGIAREHLERQAQHLYWRDVKDVRFDDESKEWVTVCVASPSTSSPYFDYEVRIDSESGRVVSSKRLDENT